jgi:hypothetical protein
MPLFPFYSHNKNKISILSKYTINQLASLLEYKLQENMMEFKKNSKKILEKIRNEICMRV